MERKNPYPKLEDFETNIADLSRILTKLGCKKVELVYDNVETLEKITSWCKDLPIKETRNDYKMAADELEITNAVVKYGDKTITFKQT